jgi:transcription elongation factor Elf1
MLFIEHKYISLLSNRLQRFTRLNEKSYNFRCPLCGDSQKNSYKARGYIYQKKDKMLFFCHNCGASMLFGNFLKQIDNNLYNEYSQEMFLNKERPKEKDVDITKIEHPKFRIDSPLKYLKKISQLEPDHPVKRYVMRRKIPSVSYAMHRGLNSG